MEIEAKTGTGGERLDSGPRRGRRDDPQSIPPILGDHHAALPQASQVPSNTTSCPVI